jgi:parallel beta-helix repeat protein
LPKKAGGRRLLGKKGLDACGLVLTILFLSSLGLNAHVFSAHTSASDVQVGIKIGDWIKLDYTLTGWPAGTPYPQWLRAEFLSFEGTNITVKVTMHSSDGTEQNETVPIDVVAGGQALGLSGLVIPANMTTGDTVYISGYGSVEIAGETTGSYAGANRTVVYTSFSQYGTQLAYYWDKQTGVMVEASTTSGGMTGTAKATETNMWQPESSGTIYIRADGSIDPPTAPISTVDNATYVLTGNITTDADGIVIERNNIIIDGAGYTIQGTGVYPYKGIDLSGRSNVTIENMEIVMFESGISLYSSSNIYISENNITANEGYGIYLYGSSMNDICGNNIYGNDYCGIDFESSFNNTVSGNNVTANDEYGIWLRESSNNNIAGNNVTNNDLGIVLSYSSNSMLRNNCMANNKGNFGVYGDLPSYFLNDVDASNTVDGKPVYYWINRQDMEVPLGVGYLALVSCTRITVENLNLTSNREGILLVSTTNSTIIRNNIAGNDFGIDLEWSPNNTISWNNVTANDDYGIWLRESSNNNIAGNNVTANVVAYGSIYLYESSKNTISGNSITNNEYGICLDDSSNNDVDENNVTNNGEGIYLRGSSNNIIAGNTLVNDGLVVFDSYGNSVEGNLVNDKPLVYLEDRSGYAFEDAGQVILVNCTYITIENLNLSNTTVGIQLWRTNNTKITNNSISNNSHDGIGLDRSINNSMVGNSITNNWNGIRLSGSSNDSVSGNSIIANIQYGIRLDYSSNNSIVGNNVTDNGIGTGPPGSGIELSYSSNNSIVGSNITNNCQYGISVFDSLNNSIVGNNIANNGEGAYLSDSSNNSIYGNTVTNNDHGIWFDDSSNNSIHHNNFINNTDQVINYAFSSVNVWDDGYPSGGNYWSDYNGTDSYYGPDQNATGSDGIADTSCIIDADNTDHYPLMAPISLFDAGTRNNVPFHVAIISNCILSNFHFNPEEGPFLQFWVAGENVPIITASAWKPSPPGLSFCRVAIPKGLLWVDDGWTVLYGSSTLSYQTLTDEYCTYLYFDFPNPAAGSYTTVTIYGTHTVPEFPSFLIPALFMMTTLPAVIVYGRKPKKSWEGAVKTCTEGLA